MNMLPPELWCNVCKFLNVISLGNFSCTNRYFNYIISYNKWQILDVICDLTILIPNNLETLRAYKYIVDFNSISRLEKKIPEAIFSLEFSYMINLNVFARYQQFSDSFLTKYYTMINLTTLLRCQRLSINLLESIISRYGNEMNNLHWAYLSKNSDLTVNFIEKYIDKIEFVNLSQNILIIYDIIQHYKDKLSWIELTKLGLIESILNKYINKLTPQCWQNVSIFSQLSMKFIVNNIDSLHLRSLLITQTLDSETLLVVHNKCLEKKIEHWDELAMYQCLPYNFIKQFKDNLNLNKLVSNKKLSRKALHAVYS